MDNINTLQFCKGMFNGIGSRPPKGDLKQVLKPYIIHISIYINMYHILYI